jgi:hypothetical protein
VVGDHEPEHGVAEELEALVRLVPGVLGTPAAVGERGRQVGFVRKRPAQPFMQSCEAGDGEQEPLLQPRDDVVDGVPDGLQVGEVLVVDVKADGPLAQLLFERFNELDEGEGVGIEVVDERITFMDGGWLDLEDVGEAVTDQLEHAIAVEWSLLHVGLGRHAWLLVLDGTAAEHTPRERLPACERWVKR